MASELRKSILEADDIPHEMLKIPEWGVEVEVRGMNGLERAGFLRRATGDDGEVAYERFYPELVIATVFDESGQKVFEPADRDAINAKSGAALERIASVAQRLSGLGSVDLEEAKGNFDGSPKNAST